jgi:hypothetical protein
MGKEKIQTTVYLYKDDHEWLMNYCARSDRNAAAVIRRLVKEFREENSE